MALRSVMLCGFVGVMAMDALIAMMRRLDGVSEAFGVSANAKAVDSTQEYQY